MIITPTQVLLVAISIGAIAGFRRGWAKEVLATAMVLGTMFFLNLGGAQVLTGFLMNGLTNVPAGTTASDPTPTLAACTTGLEHTVSEFVFGLMTWLGYRTSAKHSGPPKSSNHRVAGVIPGAINGGAIAYFLSQNVFPGTPLLIRTPSQLDTTSYLPGIFAVGLLGLLGVLFVTSQASKGK